MKRKIFLLGIILFASVLIGTPAFVVNASVESAQTELASLSTKKGKLVAKLQSAQQDNAEAQAKVEANQDKPKSLAYKNAVKKVESTQAKIDEYSAEISSIDQQIVALQKEIAAQPAAVENAPVAPATSSNNSYDDEIESLNHEVLSNLDKDDKKKMREVEDIEPIKSNVTGIESEKKESTEFTAEEKKWLWIIFGLIVLYIIYRIIRWVNWHKCPHCKKKWAMEVIDEQDCGTVKKEKVKKSDGTYEWVYYHKIKVTRQCKHCGHQVWHNETRKEA